MPAPQPASMGNQTFVKAKDDFFASLSAAEKAQFAECSTAQELLDHVQKMDIISKTKRRGMPLFRTIKNFSNRLSPYLSNGQGVRQVNYENSDLLQEALEPHYIHKIGGED